MNYNDIISNVCVYGLNESVHASGLPMQTKYKSYTECMGNAEIQQKNWKRAEKLGNVEIGSGHDQYLSTIIVQFDLRIPVKMWTEIQRYNFIDFCSSMSTMHCITKFNLEEQYDSHVDKRIIDIMKEKALVTIAIWSIILTGYYLLILKALPNQQLSWLIGMIVSFVQVISYGKIE